jgi:colicin import membrane protein
MTAATLTRDALIPRNPDGLGRGLGLALLVHSLLLVALAFSVNWRSSNPAGVEAELWAAVPQIAAPRAVEPEPTPQPQPKKVEPPPPPPKVEPVQKVPDAQIAIEKAKREEEKRKEEAKREEQQRQKDEALRKQAELDKKKKEAAEQQKRAVAEAAAAEKRREDQLKRLAGIAGATGEPNSTGTAARTAGPSATYAGRIKARIMPNIVFGDTIAGNPQATVEVKAGPDGTIIGKRLLKSSGVPAWDEAVLRAIDKTEVLPRDTDGRVPPAFEISFRPHE